MKVLQRVLVAIAVAGVASQASATTLNLTSEPSSGTINGALFVQVDEQSTGTGVIDPFVRLGTNEDLVEGFNTDGVRYYDEKAGPWTHSLLVSDIPEVGFDSTGSPCTIGDAGCTAYYQFLLDINQTGTDPLLSLYELQVLIGSTASPSGPNIDANGNLILSGATLLYDLDAGAVDGDSVINLDYSLNTGSGSGDMFFYMPKPALIDESQFLYLYSKFGIPNNNNDGFEEWTLFCTPTSPDDPDCVGGGSDGGTDSETPVPEPGSLILLGSGLVLAANRFRRRHAK